ncbi:unnamed protein product [Cylicostephanus goldi]|uniref:Uncharacterized protein n=1 Tax=Cylicostephanus goldi TaxID=71465 RepID=A0A3P7MF25_CYLGO|nr:unnamed protein product [Cylicostephanus goldi]
MEMRYISLQKRVPVWKRHVFPATPVGSSDPFELPSNLTPALKRVKSRAKLPAKGSGATASLSKLTTFNKCSSFLGAPPLRCSPRKNPASVAKPNPDCDAILSKESSSEVSTTTVLGSDDCKADVPTPSRARVIGVTSYDQTIFMNERDVFRVIFSQPLCHQRNLVFPLCT